MESIQKLIEIITPNKLKGINLITNLKEDSKLKKLYMGYHEKNGKMTMRLSQNCMVQTPKETLFSS